MNKALARREAALVTGKLIQNYLDVGQPYGDCISGHRKEHRRADPDTCKDCDREYAAFERLQREMERRGRV